MTASLQFNSFNNTYKTHGMGLLLSTPSTQRHSSLFTSKPIFDTFLPVHKS